MTETTRDRERIWKTARYCPRCGYEHFSIKKHYIIGCDTLVIQCWNCGRFEMEPTDLLKVVEVQNGHSGSP